LTLYPESVRFHPLFLYESMANLLGFVLIFWISRRFEKRLRSGDLFLIYLMYYPFVRFCLEFLRTDSWFFPGTPFNVVHLLSAVAIVTAITLLIVRHRKPVTVAAQGAESTLSVGNGETSEIAPEKTSESSAEPVEVDAGEDEHTTDKISRGKSLDAQKAEQALLANQELETADEKDTALSANGSLEQAPDKDMETVGKQTDGMRADS